MWNPPCINFIADKKVTIVRRSAVLEADRGLRGSIMIRGHETSRKNFAKLLIDISLVKSITDNEFLAQDYV